MKQRKLRPKATTEARTKKTSYAAGQTDSMTYGLFNSIYGACPCGVFLLQGQHLKLFNVAYVKQTGFSESDLLKMNPLDLVFPEDWALAPQEAKLRGRRPHSFEYRTTNRLGEVRWCKATVLPIQFEGASAALGFVEYSSNLRVGGKNQGGPEAVYKEIVESMPNAVFVNSGESTVFVNRAYMKLHGITDSRSALNRKITDFILPEDQYIIANKIQERLQGKPSTGKYEYRIRRADGEIRTVEASSGPIQWGGNLAVLTILRDISERKHLEQRTAQLAAIVDASADGIGSTDPNGKITSWNIGQQRIYGYKAEEVLGKSIALLIPTEVTSELKWILNEISLGRKIEQFETVRLRKDGSRVDVSLTVSPVFDDDGHLQTVASISRDISEQKLLRHSARQLATIVETSGDAIFGGTLEGVITTWNSAAEKLYQYSKNDAIGMHISKIVPLERRNELQRLLNTVQGGRSIRQFDTVRLRKDGSTVDVSLTVSPIIDPSGQTSGFSTIARDITESKQLQTYLSQLAAIVSSSADAIFSTTIDGMILNWNHSAEQIYGYSAEEVMGKSVSMLWLNPERADIGYLIDKAKAVQRSHPTEAVHVRKDGRKINISFMISTILDSLGNISTVSFINRDTTDIVRLHREVDQAKNMQAVGHLAGGVAHDFNNFLTPILGFAELGTRLVDEKHPVKLYLDEIAKAASNAGDITKQLLSFSSKQKSEPEVLRPSELVKEFYPLLKSFLGDNVNIALHVAKDTWATRTDLMSIKQVLLNLCLNAKDAMPDGGTVNLEVSNMSISPPGSFHNEPVPQGDYVVITVSETGVAISDGVRRHQFEPFFTAQPGGQATGLGLATALAIIKSSGGAIIVDTEEGKGTSFHALLPRVEEVSAPRMSSPSGPIPHGSERVLLVEDEASVRRVTSEMLKSLGYDVIEAENGLVALHSISAPGSQVQLVLSDLVMPFMGGWELAEELAKCNFGARIIFMSGYDDTISGASIAGRDVTIVRKPFILRDLAKAVRQSLDSPEKIVASPQPKEIKP